MSTSIKLDLLARALWYKAYWSDESLAIRYKYWRERWGLQPNKAYEKARFGHIPKQ